MAEFSIEIASPSQASYNAEERNHYLSKELIDLHSAIDSMDK
jgi:hypothetical protein